jgi:capsular exopolysaccharide synthesis family protein
MADMEEEMPMRATDPASEIYEMEDHTQPMSRKGKSSHESRVTKAMPYEERPAHESLVRNFQQIQPGYLQPAQEVELTLARLDPHLVAIHELDPVAVGQFNRLAISLISGAAKRPLRKVLIASAHHGEGRTCVSLNLAAALARAKKRVLVVDSDLQRPSVCRLLGIDSEVGLAESLAQSLPPEETIIRIRPSEFHVLPTRGQAENSAELLASPMFGRLVASLENYYDFILFDSPPLLASADASLIGLHTDVSLLVVKPGNTSTSDMAKSVTQLDEASLFGVVMNKVAG